MDSSHGFFTRFYMRLDNVLLRCKDVRIFHMFGVDSIIVESTLREGKMSGREQFRPADVIARLLPVKQLTTHVEYLCGAREQNTQ